MVLLGQSDQDTTPRLDLVECLPAKTADYRKSDQAPHQSETKISRLDVVLKTIQNIYDPNEDTTETKLSIKRDARLNRHNSAPGEISTVDKLRGKYEDVVKQPDNDACTNIVVPHANNDSVSTYADKLVEGQNRKSINALLQTTSNIEKLQNNLTTKLREDTIEQLRIKYSPSNFGYPRTIPTPKTPKQVTFTHDLPSRIPVPAPRAFKTQLSNESSSPEAIKTVTVQSVTLSDETEKKSIALERERRDENANVTVLKSSLSPVRNFEEILVTYDNIEFAQPEDKHFIARHTSSEDSIDTVENFLSDIIMEKKRKEKKRTNSFRKILGGGFFGRDKKREAAKDTMTTTKKDNAVSVDNAQNESQAFDRNSTHRHTIDSSLPRRELQRKNTFSPDTSTSGPLFYYSPQTRQPLPTKTENRYTEMTGSNFVSQYSPEEYVPMDNGTNTKLEDSQRSYMNVSKYIDTSSSSSNTLDSENRNCTYQNALIAQAEMRQILRNEKRAGLPTHFINKSNSPEMFRENFQDHSKNLQLVKPKAVIPINSERPLPNPYHNNPIGNSKTLDRNLNFDATKPYPQKSSLYGTIVENSNGSNNNNNRHIIVEDVYGTVFDSISTPLNLKNLSISTTHSNSELPTSPPGYGSQSSPRSLEASKLRLPSNREKIELQPRIRSPIPQAKISTEKIIATELLRKKSPDIQEKPKRLASPIRPSSYQENRVNSPLSPPNAQSTPENAKRLLSNTNHVYRNSPVLKSKPPLSPRIDCIEAAEWQRCQRDLDKSPPMQKPQHITTNVMIHANPEDELYDVRNNYRSHFNTPPRSLNSSLNNVRPQTPTQRQQSSPSPSSRSPEKQDILQNVEAFYWRELRRLKDQEEQDLIRYRQQQLYTYGYVEDPVITRRSRSVSPSVRSGQRSLSLPREVRVANGQPFQQRAPESIPEGRPVIAKQPIALPVDSMYAQVRQPVQRNPNFIRNNFERSTIGPIGTNGNSRMYENYYQYHHPGAGYKQVHTPPIFKRGSLTGNVVPDTQAQSSKKVSFIRNPNNPPSWPTKNGFTKSPPTRRIEREVAPVDDDDVFVSYVNTLPQSSKIEEAGYVNRLPQHIKMPEIRNHVTPYPGMKQQQIYQHRESAVAPNRTEVDYVERRYREDPRKSLEPLYGSKPVTVSNKVCDIYGQIHDPRIVPQNYGHIKQTGLVYGQLQQSPTKSPAMVRHNYNSYNQLNSSSQNGNFVRGTRLTASVNDMYKRYPNEQQRYPNEQQRYIMEQQRYQPGAIYTTEAPYRPLPPLPERRDSRGITVRRMPHISDTESGSEAGEVQRILHSGTRPKNFTVIGK